MRIVTLNCLALVLLTGCSDKAPTAHRDDVRAARSEASTGVERIELSPGQVRAAGIVIEQAGPAVIREGLPVYGVIAQNAEHVRDVGARFPGVIRSVRARVGDAVRAGDTLATVESNESLQTYPVVAPLGGVVTARAANPGEQTGDKSLFTIADLSTVWVELALFPRDSARVRVGQAVRVASTDTGLRAEGRIVYVAPFGSSNQTRTARVQIANPERRWAPGLYVDAEITLSESPVRLAVRNEALQRLEGDTVVFVAGDGGFESRPVRIGRSDAEWSEVLAGLAPGERYAAANSFILKAELGKGAAGHEH